MADLDLDRIEREAQESMHDFAEDLLALAAEVRQLRKLADLAMGMGSEHVRLREELDAEALRANLAEAEVRRLREDRDRWRSNRRNAEAVVGEVGDELGEMREQRDLLREELAEMTGHRDAYMRDRDRWHAENARLRERLDAAELVCISYGSSAAQPTTDGGKATLELWTAWDDLAGLDSADYSELLPDERIAELARQRDAKRDATLARLAKLDREVPDDDA